ncbi:hypothetical protein [Cupriavidus basilensis]
MRAQACRVGLQRERLAVRRWRPGGGSIRAAAGEPLTSSKTRVPAACPSLDAGGLLPGAAAPSTVTIDPAVVHRQRSQQAAGSPLDADQVVTPYARSCVP